MNDREHKGPSFRLELPISQRWQNIDALHRTIAGSTEDLLDDPRISQTLAMVASELIENAVKYGAWSRSRAAGVVVQRRETPTGDVIEIEVTNPVHGAGDFLAVQSTLDWIASFPSPREAYISRIRQLAEDVEIEQSRLGLVRVAYEGGCQVRAELLEGDMLRVTAALPVTSP
ncbi:MAG: hypothetical protein IT372_30445 [Polyangiaceae bacterium]|nr:hypothetical protein [Polyangiaceae bacterium]